MGDEKIKEKIPAVPSRKKTDTLLIADAELKDVMVLFAKVHLGVPPEKIRFVKTFDQLATELAKYETIERLVIYTHGTPGGLLLGGSLKGLKEILKDSFSGNRKPRVTKQIEMEGCNIGGGADEMISFARAFDAPRISGWTYSHANQTFDLNIPTGANPDRLRALRTVLREYKFAGYLMQEVDDVLKPGKNKLLFEWFQEDLADRALVTDGLAEGPGLGTEHTFKPRKEVKDHVVKPDAAQDVANEILADSRAERIIVVMGP